MKKLCLLMHVGGWISVRNESFKAYCLFFARMLACIFRTATCKEHGYWHPALPSLAVWLTHTCNPQKRGYRLELPTIDTLQKIQSGKVLRVLACYSFTLHGKKKLRT